MPVYGFHPTSASLVIDDGPDVWFRLSYNHRAYKTPATFGFGNVGNLWTFNCLTY